MSGAYETEYWEEWGEQLEQTVQTGGQRLDAFCAMTFSMSRAQVQRAIAQGGGLVNGKEAKAAYKLQPGDQVTLRLPPAMELEARPEDIPISIVYEDGDIAVVDKPQGMVVHPAPGNPDGTLVNALLYHLTDLSGVGGALRPGIVHRIDKMTSGLMVVAKNDLAHQSLSDQLKAHSARRTYIAIVEGNLREDQGTVNAPIGRSRTDRKRMAVTEKNSRHAVTHFEVLARYKGFTHVRLKLETGRTHQIRIHLKHLGFPLVGDYLYNPDMEYISRQALHSFPLAGCPWPVSAKKPSSNRGCSSAPRICRNLLPPVPTKRAGAALPAP